MRHWFAILILMCVGALQARAQDARVIYSQKSTLSRIFVVDEESRVLAIDSEGRVFTVDEESRVLVVNC